MTATAELLPPPLLGNPDEPNLMGGYVGPSPADVAGFTAMAEFLCTGCTAIPLPYQRRPGDMGGLMLRAHAMNVPMGVALDHVYVVPGGRTGLTAQLMAALLRRAGITIKTRRHTDQVCELTFHERTSTGRERKIGSSKYTINEAAKLGLLRFAWWRAVPEDCLWARALSRGVRRLFTHVVMFGYTREELYEADRGDGTAEEPVTLPREVEELLAAAATATPDEIKTALIPAARKAKLLQLLLPGGGTLEAALIDAWHHAVTRRHAAVADQALADGAAQPEPAAPACPCDPVRVAEVGQHDEGCHERPAG